MSEEKPAPKLNSMEKIADYLRLKAEDIQESDYLSAVKLIKAADLINKEKPASAEKLYPCKDCGTLRTKAEGGTTFTVCDDCWEKHYKKEKPADQQPQGFEEWLEYIITLDKATWTYKEIVTKDNQKKLDYLLTRIVEDTWKASAAQNLGTKLFKERFAAELDAKTRQKFHNADQQPQGFECEQTETTINLDDCDCSDAEDCPAYKKATGIKQIEERYRELVELVEEYKQLLFKIQNSRKGNAPERVYCGNLFRVDRIDKETERVLTALEKLEKQNAN
jgi:hypothetical protein